MHSISNRIGLLENQINNRIFLQQSSSRIEWLNDLNDKFIMPEKDVFV